MGKEYWQFPSTGSSSLMKRGGKGFTLVELLLALAIMGLIVGPIAMATITLVTGSKEAADCHIVLQQVHNASHSISRDIEMAKDVTLSDPNGFPLIIVIPVDNDENNDYSVHYSFDDNKLKRRLYDSSNNLISETLIAECIDAENTTCIDLESGFYKLDIRASRGETAVTMSYKLSQRAGG